MSDKKAPKPKLSQITSKIDTGLASKPSTAVLAKPRPPSAVSRTSSLAGRKKPSPSLTTPVRTRPLTSAGSSMRFSQSSKLSIATIDERPQQKSIHKLGKLPSYLKRTRPATANSPLKPIKSELGKNKDSDREALQKVLQFESVHHQKFRSDVSEQYGKYEKSKKALEGVAESVKENEADVKRETTGTSQLEEAVNKLCQVTPDQNARPPCEGSGDAQAIRLELAEAHEKLKQLEQRCKKHEEEDRERKKRISELEATIEGNTKVIKERDESIQQLNKTVENLRTISSSRDDLSRSELRELQQKVSELQVDIVQKSKDLLQSEGRISVLDGRIEDLKKQLFEASETVEEKNKRITELMAKAADAEAVKDRLDQSERTKRSSEELAQKLQREVSSLQEEIIKRDDQISKLKSVEPAGPIKVELEARKVELETLQETVKRFQYENKLLVNAKNQDDILLQIRADLLVSLESSNAAYKAQCEEMSRGLGGDDEIEAAQGQGEGLNDKQIISEQNRRKCKNLRSTLLGMLRSLKQENRQMREIMANCEPKELMKRYEEPTKDDNRLKDQVLNQMCALFPNEPGLREKQAEHERVEEQYVGRIVYEK